MDAIYARLAPEEIPWCVETPPAILVELVDSGWVKPCDAVDLGCGAGSYTVWLASQGFSVTGIDLSHRAIQRAKQLARAKKVECRFLATDLLGNLEPMRASFDFAFDWEVLHHVFPQQRNRYVQNVHGLLRPGGRYLSVCFAEGDSAIPGAPSKYRKTPLGTTLYFSSLEELEHLFCRFFDIEELSPQEIPGKSGPHLAVKALMTRKDSIR